MSNIPADQQCWFKTCKFRGVEEIPYKGMYVLMCSKHVMQFKTSHEKHSR